MNREIRIINYVFKINDKINLISIEQYSNYQQNPAKIKLLYGNEYLEKEILNVILEPNKLSFDDSKIAADMIEVNIGTYSIKLNIDNKDLLNEYQKSTVKNYYKLFESNMFYGKINEEEVTGKLFLDYEILKTIPDEYYKMYAIDFINFHGIFSFLSHDGKGITLNLSYKDEVFKNKKVLNVKKINLFKLSNVKLKCSGHCLWTINYNQVKVFKAMPSIIPFKYVKGNLILKMKKNLFKTDLNAMSKENLLITYQFN